MGVNIKGGSVFLAMAEPDSELLARHVGVPGKLDRNPDLEESASLVDLRDRIRQDLSAGLVDRVFLVQTRSYSNWQYKHAYDRIVAISSVIFAASELGISFETQKTERIAKAVGVAANALQTVEFSQFGFDSRPTYWTAGLAEAYAATAI